MGCPLTGLVAGIDEAGASASGGSRRLLLRRRGRECPDRVKR